MKFVETDREFFSAVPPNTAPDYDVENPIMRIVHQIEDTPLAAEREHYLADSIQHLMPYSDVGLYGPTGGQWQESDPYQQDNKNDFQKQNIETFKIGDMTFVRGYATAGSWTGAFLKVCYTDGPYSTLWQVSGGDLGEFLKLWIKVGESETSQLVTVPYNSLTNQYEVEFWSFSDQQNFLLDVLGPKGKAALASGAIQLRPDLVKGTPDAFTGSGFDAEREAAIRSNNAVHMWNRATDHTLHPIRNLRLELAWANHNESAWDSRNGENHIYEFSMVLRGWNHYLQIGQSKNPHGGIGHLEFRNLLSNYFDHETMRQNTLAEEWSAELGRKLVPGNFDANTYHPTEAGGPKVQQEKSETFMTVDYMDLHVVLPSCGIGIHRHRDNQEVFLLMQGKALMIVGDWCEFEPRQRAFETRVMLPGDLTLCKTGQLHALYNALDEPASLFMFGGYD